MRILLFFLLVGSASMSLYAQSKATKESFPTYQQIKPAPVEIIDFVSSTGQSGQSLIPARQFSVNLFDYPAKTVTYILNSKPITNARHAKKSLTKRKRRSNE